MTKADCLHCRIGQSHTFHDDGSPNLAYAYEGTEPPVQDSRPHWCGVGVDGCNCNESAYESICDVSGCRDHDFEHDVKPCPDGACVLESAHRGPHMNYRPGETLLLNPNEEPPTLKQWRGRTEDEQPRRLMQQAEQLVYGDRQSSYGHPYDDYSRTAGMWSSFLGIEITPAQAALMMVLLKISRERNRPKDDNIVDAHGYLLCYGRIQGREGNDQAA